MEADGHAQIFFVQPAFLQNTVEHTYNDVGTKNLFILVTAPTVWQQKRGKKGSKSPKFSNALRSTHPPFLALPHASSFGRTKK